MRQPRERFPVVQELAHWAAANGERGRQYAEDQEVPGVLALPYMET